MEKGLLITADKNSADGLLTLNTEITGCAAIMKQTGDTELVITVTLKNSAIGDHDTTKIGKNQAFIKSANGSDIQLNIPKSIIKLQSSDPTSGKFEDITLAFVITAPDGGKVGGPGLP